MTTRERQARHREKLRSEGKAQVLLTLPADLLMAAQERATLAGLTVSGLVAQALEGELRAARDGHGPGPGPGTPREMILGGDGAFTVAKP